MAETNLTANRWVYGLAYFGLMGGIMLVQILPLDLGLYDLPGPDMMLCITFAWVLRRPQYVPTPLIAGVFLVADMLLMRPPGLWTGIVVLCVEVLRNRAGPSRDQPFLLEWAMVAVLVLGASVLEALVLAIFFVDQAGLGLSLLKFLATVFTYPIVVLASRWVFHVEKMTPGELDAWGRRI